MLYLDHFGWRQSVLLSWCEDDIHCVAGSFSVASVNSIIDLVACRRLIPLNYSLLPLASLDKGGHTLKPFFAHQQLLYIGHCNVPLQKELVQVFEGRNRTTVSSNLQELLLLPVSNCVPPCADCCADSVFLVAPLIDAIKSTNFRMVSLLLTVI